MFLLIETKLHQFNKFVLILFIKAKYDTLLIKNHVFPVPGGIVGFKLIYFQVAC
jgi:hypothetical protein